MSRARPASALAAAALLAACGPSGPSAPPPARVAAAESVAVCGEPSTLDAAYDATLPEQGLDPDLVDGAIRHFTNKERCERDLPPVEAEPALRRAASRMAEAMARLDFFSHEAPPEAGGRLRNRVAEAGANPPRLGENIAAFPYYAFEGRSFYKRGECDFSFSPDGDRIEPLTYRGLGRTAVAEWMDSPAHREGLLDPNYTRMGAGAAVDPEEEACGVVYANQTFAGG